MPRKLSIDPKRASGTPVGAPSAKPVTQSNPGQSESDKGDPIDGIANASPDNGTVVESEPVIAGPDGGTPLEEFELVEPASVSPIGAGDPEPRKRKPRSDAGVKRGQSQKTEGQGAVAAVSSLHLTDLLYSIHLGLSKVVVPELELSREESKRLADAAAEVGKHYALTFDPKKVAIANLIGAAGLIYGSRVIAYRARKMAEKREAGPRAVPPKQADVRNAADVRNPDNWKLPADGAPIWSPGEGASDFGGAG